MTVAVLFLFTVLASYRTWRLLAVDDFPPIMAVRRWLSRVVLGRFGPDWEGGIECPWCSGSWSAFAVVAAVWHYHPLPLPALWFPAVSTMVGLIAVYDN